MAKLPARMVILMRHAKSDWEAGHESDMERRLNLRGQRDARNMAAWLKSQLAGLSSEIGGGPGSGQAPVKLLVSPARRTRETATEIRQALPKATMVIEQSLYLASLPELIELVRSHADECLLVLGHNPGLEDLVWQIDPDVEARCAHSKIFPTCAVYGYRIDGVFAQSEGRCSYLFHQRPKMLTNG